MMTRLIQFFIFFVPVVLFGVVSFGFLDLDGEVVVSWEPGEQSAFVHGLRPSGRVGDVLETGDGESYVSLDGDPVYLSVTPPGNYEVGDLKLWIRQEGQPVVEVGATVNGELGQIDLRSGAHSLLDDLGWDEVRNGDTVLYQRDSRYDYISELLEDPPNLGEIATYQFRLAEDYLVPAEWLRGDDVVLDGVSLRGTHEFVGVVDYGDIFRLDAVVMDMNRNIGADEIKVQVYQSEMGEMSLVGEAVLDDDEVDEATNASLSMRKLELETIELDAGLIYVKLLGGNDVYWRELRMNSPRATFTKNVFIGDEVGYLDGEREVRFWTDAQHLMFFTRHAEGVQTVRVGDDEVVIEKPHEHYRYENPGVGVTEVVVPRGDILVVSDGLISFSKDAFFSPFPHTLDDRTDVDKMGIDYILATYPEVEMDGEWRVLESQFELGGLEREGGVVSGVGGGAGAGAYRFVLSMPRIADRDAAVDLHRVEVRFVRKKRGFWDVVRLFFDKFM